MALKVLIADDHSLLRRRFRQVRCAQAAPGSLSIGISGNAPRFTPSMPEIVAITSGDQQSPGLIADRTTMMSLSSRTQLLLSPRCRPTYRPLSNGGLLSIGLVREVPEVMKPRQIEIANSNQPQAETVAPKVAA